MTTLTPSTPVPTALSAIAERLENGGALLPDSPENLVEVVGVLKSYAVVLDAYSINLNYIAEHQFLVLFPFFKYMNGDVTAGKLMRHWLHERINYEFAEYCMKAMFWHGGGGLDAYLDTEEFRTRATAAIQAKLKGNLMMRSINQLFPQFLLEQIRQLSFYSGLGQFWRVMSDMFMVLSDRYDAGDITSIADVVDHVKQGLVDNAAMPITYAVTIEGDRYEIIPPTAGLTFLMDTAVPYVEAVFLRSFPFFGTVSYNAQAQQIPLEQADFSYGVLFADPLPTGGAGIPPTLLMQDLTHYLPDYLRAVYAGGLRGNGDLRVKINQSFQKSMFCVTTSAILGLMPHPLNTSQPQEQQANREFIDSWLSRLEPSALLKVQTPQS